MDGASPSDGCVSSINEVVATGHERCVLGQEEGNEV
jgi:hypothetical protein